MSRPVVKPVMTDGLRELLNSLIPEHSKDMKHSELRGICLSHGYKLPSIRRCFVDEKSDEHDEFWADWIRYYSYLEKKWYGDDDHRDKFLKD